MLFVQSRLICFFVTVRFSASFCAITFSTSEFWVSFVELVVLVTLLDQTKLSLITIIKKTIIDGTIANPKSRSPSVSDEATKRQIKINVGIEYAIKNRILRTTLNMQNF